MAEPIVVSGRKVFLIESNELSACHVCCFYAEHLDGFDDDHRDKNTTSCFATGRARVCQTKESRGFYVTSITDYLTKKLTGEAP